MNKNIRKIAEIFFISLFFLLTSISIALPQSRDTTTVSDSLSFQNKKISSAPYLSTNSDTTSYSKYYLWNDRRTLPEILNERAGYFVNDMGQTGINPVQFNSIYGLGFFRDGIPIYDPLLVNRFEPQLISVNEIDKIEEVSNVSSYLYGTAFFNKSVNIITKNFFQPRAFSQIRYSQDRYNSLNLDAIFSRSIAKQFNVQLGINKGSLNGRYENSDFDVWRVRGRLSYYSRKVNVTANVYFADIERGLWGGLIYQDSSTVQNPNYRQDNSTYNYDLITSIRLFRDTNSVTKLKLYSYNSIDKLFSRDVLNPFENNNHTISYTAELTQSFNIKLSKDYNFKILGGGIFQRNLYNSNNFSVAPELTGNLYTAYSKIDFSSPFINVSPSIKYLKDNYDSNVGFGVEVKMKPQKYLNIFAGINKIQGDVLFRQTKYYEAGMSLNTDIFYIKSYYWNYDYIGNFEGLNTSIEAKTKYVDGYINYNYVPVYHNTSGIPDSYFNTMPEHFVKADVSYHNLFFNNKLNLRIGLNAKLYEGIRTITESGSVIYNLFNGGTLVDFYIGARIGRANINLTIANIFDKFYYDTYLFPKDERDGFLQSFSRFTIVWDFLN